MEDLVADMRGVRDAFDGFAAHSTNESHAGAPVGATHAGVTDDDSDDEAECRVCRGEAEPDRRLFAPCKCSGSIRFTHSDCLEQWLEHSGKVYCELCGYKFEFKPLYDASAPDVLPWTELVSTVLSMACFKWFPFIVRAFLVIALWLGIAPWCTSWLYRMWLLRASAMVNVNFSERFDTDHVIADIFSGIILIVVIIFSFLALMSFADFLRFHLDHIDEPLEEPHHHHHHHVHHAPARRLNGNEAPQGGPEGEAVVGQAVVDERRRAEEDEASSDEEAEDHGHLAHQDNPMPFNGVFAEHPREDLGFPAAERVAEEDVILDNGGAEQGLRQRRPLRGLPPIGAAAPAGNEPVPIPRAEDIPDVAQPRNAVRAQPNRANPANHEWEDDFEHMEINIAMDELLGLRGDIVVLFRNVSWLLAFNGAYLGLFAFIPYTLGSTIFSASVKIYSALPFGPGLLSSLAWNGDVASSDLSIGQFVARMLTESMEAAKTNGDCLQLVDLCTCAMGYLSICFTIVLWRWMVTTASSYIHRPIMGGLLWALRCLTAIVKVSSLLLLKMVVLPIVLGLGIDFATLQLFLVTPHDRIEFCMQNMVGSLLVHWVLGITFMLFVTVSVLQLREVAHPDILAKVIRPQEAHPDLLRSLLSEKCVKHARRMLLSLLIYAALLVVLIHLPIRIVHAIAPSYFPLTLRFQHYSPEIQVPIELLVVHLIVLGVLEHAKNEIGRFQHIGITFVCKQLGLAEYLLPRVEVTWTTRMAVPGDVHVLPPPPLHFHPQAELPPDELRIGGHRYLPWPEEGLDDPQPTEYVLLPRRTPRHLHARVATLIICGWFVLVFTMGTLIFGTFFLGRACMGPFERLTGISHDPLALAAGVQIVWYLMCGLNALNMITLPEDQVEATLVERGYCVKNMTPENAIASVLGWAFLCPFLVGCLMSACFPSAKATWFESFWMGYLLFNLFAWFVCCFRTTRNRRRRRNRRDFPLDEDFEDNFDDFEVHGDLVDDMEDDLDDEDEDVNAGVGEIDDAEPAAREDVEVEGIFASLRRSYKQIMFNITVHENDAVRLREDNIRELCFDLQFFMERVMYPVISLLVTVILMCWGQAALLIYVWSSSNTNLPETAFAISALGTATAVCLVRSHSFLFKWMANFAESIRNERYLIGRELQDMIR